MTEQEITDNLQLLERMLRDPSAEISLLRGTQQVDKSEPTEHFVPTVGKTAIIRTGGGARNEEKISHDAYVRRQA